MLFRRLKSAGLAHHSYLLDCGEGQAVVVDPRRDIAEYLRLARHNDLTIACVLETHRQEDFEFGSADLAGVTGARIVTGDHPLCGRSDLRLADGADLRVGTTRFVALATPGHTPESVSYAAYPKNATPACWAVFTGDALFVGATGRTDLSDPGRTGENAALLFDAIHGKIAPLGDQALVLAAHGSGSTCGSNIADRDDSTLGVEKVTNPVFTKNRAEFVAHKLAERLPRPPYFAHMEQVNLEGGRRLPRASAIRVLHPEPFRKASSAGLIIDTRPPDAFAACHIRGACNIWLGGLAPFAGWIADEGTRIHLVTQAPGDVRMAALALARIGLDRVDGFLAGGIAAWREQGLPFATTGITSATQCAEWMKQRVAQVLDVRDANEWNEGHVPGAMHAYVGDLINDVPDLPRDQRLVVHCSVGNRAGLAVSILERAGFTNLYNMLGGIKAWKKLQLPLATNG